MRRRQILVFGAAAAALAATPFAVAPVRPARADKGEVFDDDRMLGPADSKVTIIEYSSLTCPHCARFHETTFQNIKADWIEPGRALFVHRHFPLDQLALRAALLSNCLKGKEHFAMLDALFRGQQRWAKAEDPMAALATIARLAGIDQQRFEACVGDESELDLILARAQDGQKTYEVNSTPTLIVNGEKVEDPLDYEAFRKTLERAAASS